MAEPTLYEYSPDSVSLVFNGINILGFQDGTFVEVERMSDGFTSHAGSLGNVARTKNLDRRAKITITLMQGAATNDLLSAVAKSDEEGTGGAGVGAFQMTQANSPKLLVHAEEAWIVRQPKIGREKESGGIVWTIEAAVCEIFAAGSVS